MLYVEYSKNVSNQARQHEEGEISWLADLVESVCQVLFRKRQFFTFHNYPVCYLEEADEISVSELAITYISDARYDTAGGFGVYEPGIQATSGTGKGHREEWEVGRDWRMPKTPYKDACKEEELWAIRERGLATINGCIEILDAINRRLQQMNHQ